MCAGYKSTIRPLYTFLFYVMPHINIKCKDKRPKERTDVQYDPLLVSSPRRPVRVVLLVSSPRRPVRVVLLVSSPRRPVRGQETSRFACL